MQILCSCVVVFLLVASAVADSCDDWGGVGLQWSSKCFRFSSTATTFETAALSCQAIGGQLATIESAEENNLVHGLLHQFNQKRVWIGFNDIQQEDDWKWLDGSASTYTNWGFYRPDNYRGTQHCAVVDSGVNNEFWNYNNPGEWDDRPCGSFYNYVCTRNFNSCATWGGQAVPGSNKCFWVTQNASLNFKDADESCQAMGAHLATIESHAENRLVTGMLEEAQVDRMWIGLTCQNKEKWEWVEGKNLTGYTNWGHGQPNNYGGLQECAVIDAGNVHNHYNHNNLGEWDDRSCTSSGYRYVCAKVFEPSPPYNRTTWGETEDGDESTKDRTTFTGNSDENTSSPPPSEEGGDMSVMVLVVSASCGSILIFFLAFLSYSKCKAVHRQERVALASFSGFGAPSAPALLPRPLLPAPPGAGATLWGELALSEEGAECGGEEALRGGALVGIPLQWRVAPSLLVPALSPSPPLQLSAPLEPVTLSSSEAADAELMVAEIEEEGGTEGGSRRAEAEEEAGLSGGMEEANLRERGDEEGRDEQGGAVSAEAPRSSDHSAPALV